FRGCGGFTGAEPGRKIPDGSGFRFRVSSAENQLVAATHDALLVKETGVGRSHGGFGGGAVGGGFSPPAMATFAAGIPLDGDGAEGEGSGGHAATNPALPALVRRIVPELEHPAAIDRGVSRRRLCFRPCRRNPRPRDG